MKSSQLIERIEKAEEKLLNKTNTIEKKLLWIEKRITKIESLGYEYISNNGEERLKYTKYGETPNLDIYDLYYDIKTYTEDISRAKEDIESIKNTIEKYKTQLAIEVAKETKLQDIPQILKDYKQYLISTWTEQDIKAKEFYKTEYNKLDYGEFIKKYSLRAYDHMGLKEKDFIKQNTLDAENVIFNLISRTHEIVGDITDCSCLETNQDNQGFSIINGIITGNKGKCIVESIGAGGYNIQKFHIRVLVKEI